VTATNAAGTFTWVRFIPEEKAPTFMLHQECTPTQWRSQNEAEAGAQRGHTTFASYPRTQAPPSFN